MPPDVPNSGGFVMYEKDVIRLTVVGEKVDSFIRRAKTTSPNTQTAWIVREGEWNALLIAAKKWTKKQKASVTLSRGEESEAEDRSFPLAHFLGYTFEDAYKRLLKELGPQPVLISPKVWFANGKQLAR